MGKEILRIAYVGEPGAARGRPLEVGERAAMRARWASVLVAARKPLKKRDEVPF